MRFFAGSDGAEPLCERFKPVNSLTRALDPSCLSHVNQPHTMSPEHLSICEEEDGRARGWAETLRIAS